jgi:hypothetical protein
MHGSTIFDISSRLRLIRAVFHQLAKTLRVKVTLATLRVKVTLATAWVFGQDSIFNYAIPEMPRFTGDRIDWPKKVFFPPKE